MVGFEFDRSRGRFSTSDRNEMVSLEVSFVGRRSILVRLEVLRMKPIGGKVRSFSSGSSASLTSVGVSVRRFVCPHGSLLVCLFNGLLVRQIRWDPRDVATARVWRRSRPASLPIRGELRVSVPGHGRPSRDVRWVLPRQAI